MTIYNGTVDKMWCRIRHQIYGVEIVCKHINKFMINKKMRSVQVFIV
jgi:hypothetical protein